MKRTLGIVLGILTFLIVCPGSPTLADTTNNIDMEIYVNDNTSITATVPKEFQQLLNNQDLLDIALDEGLKDGQHITIHHVESANDEIGISPYLIVLNSYPTTLTKVGTEWAAQSYFVISVAKGQTTTLTSAFSQELTAGISGSYYSVTAELKGSVKASYSITHQFTGPPESSYYNSREYRVRFYAQTYNFNQHHYMSGMYIGTKTGTVKKPTRWASYSIDSRQ